MNADLYYSSGRAAQLLGTSQAQLRMLCESGTIKATMTPGGQWRISCEEVERVKGEGLPPAPRPLPDASVASRTTGASGRNSLLAAPGPRVIDSAERALAASNLLRQRRVELELAMAEDQLRQHRQAVVERELGKYRAERQRKQEQDEAERQKRKAADEAERVKRWRDSWADYAAQAAAEAPAPCRLDAHDRVAALLARLSSTLDRDTVRSLVDAELHEALLPWRHQQLKQRVAMDCEKQLPYWSKSSAPPKTSEWQHAVHKLVDQAADGFGDNATYEEMMALMAPGVDELVRCCEHCRRVERFLYWKLSLSEEERRAVAAALAKLPVGATEQEMEAVVQASLKRRTA